MSFFEGQTPAWTQQHGRQQSQSWDQSTSNIHAGNFVRGTHEMDFTVTTRAGSGSIPSREEGSAFSCQFEEIERASDNLSKSGKGFGGMPGGRREPMPMLGSFARQYPDFDRMPNPRSHNSVADYDGLRSHSSHSSSSVQGYIANQRFGPRPNEAEQMMQAKRRAAAQRERELRNYHQEQQYNRRPDLSAAKSDRSISPSAMNEEERRELIARQHRALYGDGSNLYTGDASSRPVSQDARVLAAATSGHGSSPLAFDAFNPPAGVSTESSAPAQTGSGHQRSPTTSADSKSPNPNAFTMFDNSQQIRTSTSSPGGSPPRQGTATTSGNGVAPIGTRPTQATAQAKRTTPPTSSPLNFGFASDKNATAERSTSAASNPTNGGAEKPVSLGWGANAGPWASNKGALGVQASVWG